MEEIKTKIEVSIAATQTGPIEELFEGQEFVLAAEYQKWQSSASDHKKETTRV